jgi:hypothetical protein
MPAELRLKLYAAFDVHALFRAHKNQVTITATITDTTPGIITALLNDSRTDDDTVTPRKNPPNAAMAHASVRRERKELTVRVAAFQKEPVLQDARASSAAIAQDVSWAAGEGADSPCSRRPAWTDTAMTARRLPREHGRSTTRRCGTVVWTRGRWAPDLLPRVCEWIEELGFERIRLSPPGFPAGCGAHRFAGTPVRLEEGAGMFTFRGHHPVTGPPRS